MSQNDYILQRDTWNEAQHSFQISVPCPFCSRPLSKETNHHLSRCSSCNGLLEWVLHKGETNIYWPRTISDNFSSFDGRRYNHASFFDNAEMNGEQGKTSGNLDPEMAIWNVPSDQYFFKLQPAWPKPEESVLNKWKEIFQFPPRVVPQSLLVMHGNLLVARNDGAITNFMNVDGDWENIKRTEFPSVFADNRMNERSFRYRPCGCFPYVLISNEKECVIWKHSFGVTGASHEKFELPIEIQNKKCYMLGSPTSFYLNNRLAFVFSMVGHNSSDGSYVCAFVQKEVDGPFTMVILRVGYQLDYSMLFSRTRESLISLLLQGHRFLEYPIKNFWDFSAFAQKRETSTFWYAELGRDNMFQSDLGHQCKFNQSNCMAIQYRDQSEYLVIVFDSLTTSKTYLSHIKLRDLNMEGRTHSWHTKEVQGDFNGQVQALSIGSCKGNLRAGHNLLTTVALTTQNGVAVIDLMTGQSCGTFISDTGGIIQNTHKDAAILTNAGIVSKVGTQLSLSWDMLDWGAPVSLDAATNTVVGMAQKNTKHPLHSVYISGLTMLNHRIFVTKYSHTESTGLSVYQIEAIDIIKCARNLKK